MSVFINCILKRTLSVLLPPNPLIRQFPSFNPTSQIDVCGYDLFRPVKLTSCFRVVSLPCCTLCCRACAHLCKSDVDFYSKRPGVVYCCDISPAGGTVGARARESEQDIWMSEKTEHFATTRRSDAFRAPLIDRRD